MELEIQTQLQYKKRIAFCSLTLMQILVIQAINENVPWTIAFLPLSSFIYLLPVSVYSTLNSIRPEIKESTKQFIYCGTFYLLINAFVFFTNLGLKLDGVISNGWGYIYIPIWYSLGISLGSMYFTSPDLSEKSMNKNRQIVTALIWILALTQSSIFHVLYL